MFMKTMLVSLCLSPDHLPMNSRYDDGYFHPLLASLSSLDMSSEQLHWKHYFLFAQSYLPNIQHAILKGKSLKMSKKSLSSKDFNFPVFLLTGLQKVNKDDNI